MAEGPDPVSETTLELEQEVTCAICHDHYQEPKLLPCCHYYCKQCILSLSSRYSPNRSFPCPDCREPTLLPGNNPDRLPTAFFVNRMKDLHSRMEKAHGKLEALCELCSGGKASAFCRQCVHFICTKCVKSHQRMKTFAGHVVSTLEELEQGEVKELLAVSTPPLKCADHEEPRKIFCFDCNQLICRDCVVIDHAGHKYEFVKKAAPDTRKKLVEHLSPLKNLMPGLSSAVNRVRDTKHEIQAEGKLTEKQVNAKFQELHQILDQCKACVLKETNNIMERKVKKLMVQEKDLELSVVSAESLVDFVERRLENASDEELITMQEQVLSRIDSEVVKRGKEAASADPVEEAGLGVEVFVSEDLKELCESNVIVHEGKPVVIGDGIRNAQIDKSAKLTLVCSKKNDRRKPIIQATLKSVADETSLQLEAVSMTKGVYSIEYIPKVRGRHHLLISVDGQSITGSPFSVYVRLPPTKLDKPVREMKVNRCRYLAFNSANEMIVTDYNGDLLIMNNKGERLRNISKSQYGFNHVCGVAVDKDDNIYVSDSGNNCVYKFNKSGELLKRFGKEGSGPRDMNFLRGVAVAGDRVFMCDHYNNRVQVLTSELEPVKQIGSKGSGDGQFNRPESIAVDSDGMLYVTDFGNDRIQVFTRDGQFFGLFGEKGSGQGELNSPVGVCVHAGHVYVAEYSNGHVSVFTKDGQFVTAFGEGHTIFPCGVSVDSDGFVYVCNKNYVTIF